MWLGGLRREYRAALGPASANNSASAARFHTSAEPVCTGATYFRWLKGSFHNDFFLIMGSPLAPLIFELRRNPLLHLIYAYFVNTGGPVPSPRAPRFLICSPPQNIVAVLWITLSKGRKIVTACAVARLVGLRCGGWMMRSLGL